MPELSEASAGPEVPVLDGSPGVALGEGSFVGNGVSPASPAPPSCSLLLLCSRVTFKMDPLLDQNRGRQVD